MHGELPDMSTATHTEAVDVQTGDHIEDMIQDLGQEGFWQAHAPYYEKLLKDSKNSLYLGCTTFTRLSMVLFW